MDLAAFGWLVAGLVLLVFGADRLVRGASRLAELAGVSPLVVGLTVVAAGTSSPELAAGVAAAFRGDTDLAVGNVVGSNIFNVLFLLGVAAIIRPLVVSVPLVRTEVPVMIGASAALVAFAFDGSIGRWEGVLLVVGLFVHLVLTVRRARQGRAAERESGDPAAPSSGPTAFVAVVALVAGLALLIVGADWLVDGAVTLATGWGVSERLVGLTVVAVGTSLPEVATSVVATIRGERDIAVANAVGSNVFNLLGVLGLSAIAAPAGLAVAPAALAFDIPIMVAAALACLPIFFTGWTVHRWEGWFFLGGYAAYLGVLLLSALGHPAFESLRTALVMFVVPLSAATLAVLAWRSRHQTAPGAA